MRLEMTSNDLGVEGWNWKKNHKANLRRNNDFISEEGPVTIFPLEKAFDFFLNFLQPPRKLMVSLLVLKILLIDHQMWLK